MPRDYLPKNDGGLTDWSNNFGLVVAADPARCFLTAADADRYAAARRAFEAGRARAYDPATATPLARADLCDVRRALVALSRELAMRVARSPGATDALRRELRLTVPDPDRHAPPVPDEAPRVSIRSVDAHGLRVCIADAGDVPRRPAHAAGANVFCSAGAAPPEHLQDWSFVAGTTRRELRVPLPRGATPGTRLWVTAFWFNSRCQRGPLATAAGTNVGPVGASLRDAA